MSDRDAMIIANLPLVSFVIGRMRIDSETDREDATANGILGLIQAVDHFDPLQGATFATFAIPRIRGSILDSIRKSDLLPRAVRKRARETEQASTELTTALGRFPSAGELAAKIGITVSELRSRQENAGARTVPIDAPESPDFIDPDEYGDPAEMADRKASLRLLDQALSTLSERDRVILKLRYGSELSLREIGARLGLSEARISQIHRRALNTLKSYLKQQAA